jgi:PAS domain S-box-containing protein
MMQAPLPPNEAARLAALYHYDILDTAPEAAYDDVTRLAAQICDTPMALMTLVDAHRLWCKSTVGLRLTETARDVAFCAHAIAQPDEILMVSDTLADARFADHPLVTAEPHIRFYAGAPLVTPDGFALGTLCVFDQVPRTLTPQQLAALRVLCRSLITALELRRTNGLLARATAERNQAQAASQALTHSLERMHQSEALLSGQNQVLEMMASGATLSETLATLVRYIESQAPGMLGSILLLDDDGVHVRHGAAPSLPPEYIAAIDGQPIGPCAGSCGTAAYRKEAVLVEDIATDPLWAAYKAVALPHGLRACWSTPIFDAEHRVLGTFAMYYPQPALPQPHHRQLIDTATHTAAIAISHHRAERALRSKTEELEGFFTNSLDLLCIADVDGYFRTLNPQWERTLGYALSELEGRQFLEWVHADDQAATVAALRTLTHQESVLNFVNRYQHQDGSYRWLAWRAFPLGTQIYATARDITEQKQADEALRASEARLRLVLDGLGPSLFVGLMTPDGTLIEANQPALATAGLTPADVLGKPLEQTYWLSYSTETQQQVRAAIERAARGEASRYDMQIRGMGDEFITIDFSLQPLRDKTGQVAFLVPSASDITERKRAEEALRHAYASLERRVQARTAELAVAKEKAESADRLKSVFLATMSHELRTPLNSIIGFTGIILQGLAGPLNAEQTKQLGMVRSSARHLLQLINEVLDLSKIEAGQLELATVPFDMRQLIDHVIRTITPQAESKGVLLASQCAPEVGQMLGDRRRVEQILLNLLGNAVKFTPQGEVRVVCQVADGSLVTQVIDTGIGIAAADMAHLFQPFQQLETSLARRHEGTGLGLSICKRLVELMGGHIWVESAPGLGSTFTFTLPRAGTS